MNGELAVGEVRSADGTVIGFQRVGAGPAVVLLHGAGQSSVNLVRLARALSVAFTVYVPDRRGRGRSGPYGDFRGLGRPGTALVTVLKATADRTSPLRWIPGRPLGAALDFAVRRTAGRAPRDGTMSPRELIPTVSYDARTVNGAAGPLERFAALSCEVLLLGGSRSARNLTASLDGLSQVLPHARRVVLRGAGHTAPDNSRQPDRVAAELHPFFSG